MKIGTTDRTGVIKQLDPVKCCHYPGIGHCWHCKTTENPQIQSLCPEWEDFTDIQYIHHCKTCTCI